MVGQRRDAGDFKIGRETGVLTFREPPNFDIPGGSGTHSNEYQVTVVASDGLKEETLAVTVTVTDVNEGPVIADTGANTTITVDENHDQVLDTYTATDPESQAVTRWSVTGRDGGDFSINDGWGADLPQPAGPRASRRLRPGQRVRGYRPGLRWTVLRDP